MCLLFRGLQANIDEYQHVLLMSANTDTLRVCKFMSLSMCGFCKLFRTCKCSVCPLLRRSSKQRPRLLLFSRPKFVALCAGAAFTVQKFATAAAAAAPNALCTFAAAATHARLQIWAESAGRGCLRGPFGNLKALAFPALPNKIIDQGFCGRKSCLQF